MSERSVNELVSVIVPVYKVEEYLYRCLDSLVDQSYKNLEIILVDDGSPDKCPQICDEYAVKDKRIKVIHKQNGGLSDARNAGLAIATGEWVSFVDSDDWVSSRFVEELLHHAMQNKADISVCAYFKSYDNQPDKAVASHETIRVMNNVEAIKDLFTYQKYGGVMAWNKLYSMKMFRDHGIVFPKGKLHEDNYTTYRLFHRANKIVYFNTPLLFYYQRPGSIMNKSFGVKNLDAKDAADSAREYVYIENLPLRDEVDFAVMKSRIILLQSLHRSDNIKDFSVLESELLQELSTMSSTLSGNPFLRMQDKLRLDLAKRPTLYRFFYKLHTLVAVGVL